MDQCKHCIIRGDIAACEKTECDKHEYWYVETLRARVARLEEALKRGVELHENCDADTCMCGDSMWHAPSGHKPTSMLQYYGDQWAEEAKSALEEK